MATPRDLARRIWDNVTGPIGLDRYVCTWELFARAVEAAIGEAVAAEREACARLADAACQEHSQTAHRTCTEGGVEFEVAHACLQVAAELANAIRARGQP
jgi:hypothetical protein